MNTLQESLIQISECLRILNEKIDNQTVAILKLCDGLIELSNSVKDESL